MVECNHCGLVMMSEAERCPCGQQTNTPPAKAVTKKEAVNTILALIVLFVVWAWLHSLNSSPTTATTEPAHIERGQVVRLTKSLPCAPTAEGSREIFRWISRNDNEEATLTLLRVGGKMLPVNSEVKMLDPGVYTSQVRPVDGIEACYTSAETLQAVAVR